MTKSKLTPHANIHDALQLNGKADEIVEYYNNWAKTYDADVCDNYYGITYIAQLLNESIPSALQDKLESLVIADVGCGTGLMAKALHRHGFTQLEGIDLSEAMVEKARLTNLYRSLHANIDLHNPLPAKLQQRYDAAVCLGVFTPGHVSPEALIQIINMTKPGGMVVISTRVPYYNQTSYQLVSDKLINSGIARLHGKHTDAPYRDDGDAHYWVYEVL